MIYFEYLILAVLVVYLSVRLSYYVDCLDKKTNFIRSIYWWRHAGSCDFIARIIYSLTAVLALDQPDLVQGNVLGSNIFNLCVIGGLVLFTAKRYKDASIANSHKNTLIFGIVMYLLVLFAILKPIEIGAGLL